MCLIISVLEDGISLRSGKNLKNLREVINEHDIQVEQSEVLGGRVPYNVSVAGRTQEQYNLSANAQTRSTSRKATRHGQNRGQFSQSEQKHNRYSEEKDSVTGAYLDRNSVRSRRALNTEFDRNTMQSDPRLSAYRDGKAYRHSYDERDSKPSVYSTKTTRTTVTEEFEDLEEDVTEKGAIEMSEKAAKSVQHQSAKKNINMYGKIQLGYHWEMYE